MLTAPSDIVLDRLRQRQPLSRRRSIGAIAGVLVLTMPAVLAAPTAVVAAKPPAQVQAVALRSAFTLDNGFDRPSSARLDDGEIAALSGRRLARASRDSVRTTPGAGGRESVISMERPGRPAAKTAPTRRKPKSLWNSDKWVRPGTGRFTSGFKWRWGHMHKGIDLAAPTGSPIYAAADGVVIYAGPMNGFGRLVLVRHSSSLVTAYGHMSAYRTHVGKHVRAGELIALVGSAGHSTGPHLHFEVRINGVQVNPLPFLRKHHVRV
ncbi:MAG: M23 family metallopeptidase [Actinomycetota bacterium]